MPRCCSCWSARAPPPPNHPSQRHGTSHRRVEGCPSTKPDLLGIVDACVAGSDRKCREIVAGHTVSVLPLPAVKRKKMHCRLEPAMASELGASLGHGTASAILCPSQFWRRPGEGTSCRPRFSSATATSTPPISIGIRCSAISPRLEAGRGAVLDGPRHPRRHRLAHGDHGRHQPGGHRHGPRESSLPQFGLHPES